MNPFSYLLFSPEYRSVRTSTAEQLQSLLNQSIKRIMKALTRHGALIEEEGGDLPGEISLCEFSLRKIPANPNRTYLTFLGCPYFLTSALASALGLTRRG